MSEEKISRELVVGIMLQWAGLALMVHDYIEAAETIHNPYSIQGFWWGALFSAVGFILSTWDVVDWIKRALK